MSKSRILAFDPGYDRLGVAVLERTGNTETLIYSTCVETDKTTPLVERLHTIGAAVATLIHTHTPEAVALETLFFNKNAKTAIGVAEVRGIIIYLARAASCPVYEFSPQQIKVAVTGYGKSDKQAVIDMVKRLVSGTPARAHDDEYDAIAIGVTALAHNRR